MMEMRQEPVVEQDVVLRQIERMEDRLNGRIATMDAKIDKRIDSMDAKIDRVASWGDIDSRFREVSERLDKDKAEINARLDKMEAQGLQKTLYLTGWLITALLGLLSLVSHFVRFP